MTLEFVQQLLRMLVRRLVYNLRHLFGGRVEVLQDSVSLGFVHIFQCVLCLHVGAIHNNELLILLASLDDLANLYI